MGLGSSVYKLTFDSNALQVLTPTRRELAAAKAIMLETRTAAEKYGDSLDHLNQLLNKDLITVQDYNRAVESLRSELPENVAAAEAAAEAQRQLNADLERGQQIIRQNETETERYAREVEELARLLHVGAISEADMARETQRLKVQLLGAENATERLSDAMREGRSLTKSLQTAEERRSAELNHAKQLLARGAITQDTYNRQLAKHRMESMQSIPVVGNLSSRFMALNPATAAAAAGFVLVAAEMKIVAEVARFLTSEVQKQFKAIDELAKSGRKLGVGVDDLFSMSVAAQELSGVEFGAFETAVQRMTRRVAEAANGTGEARDAIKELGLDAEALKLAGPAGAMEMFADSFANVADEGDRLRLAMKLFDSEGAGLATMLAGGSQALRDYRQEMAELGALPSPFDAAAIEPMNDAIGRVGITWGGMMKDLAVEVAPAITAIAETFTEALKPGSQLGDDIRFALESIPPTIAFAADKTNQWVGLIQLVQAGFTSAAAAAVSGLAMIDKAEAYVNPFRQASEDLQMFADTLTSDALSQNAEALQRIADGATGAIQRRVKELREEIALAGREQPAAVPLDDPAELDDKARQEVERLTQSLQEQIDTYGMSADAAARYKLAQQGVGEAELQEIERLQSLIEIQNEFDQQRKEQEAREKAVSDAIESTTAKLQEQIATLAMTAEEIELYKLAQQGVGAAELARIQALQQELGIRSKIAEAEKEESDRIKRQQDAIADYTAELEKQIATAGMSADQAKLWELAQQGATQAELDKIAALQAEAAAIEDLARTTRSSFGPELQGERSTLEGLAAARDQAMYDAFGGASTVSMPSPTSTFTVTPPAPTAPTRQPNDLTDVANKQLAELKKITKNTAAPAVEVDEVTL